MAALSILDLEVGDIVIAGTNERPLRISIAGATLYVGNGVIFTVYGTRLRKDGVAGKIRDTFSLHFEDDKKNAPK